MGIVTVDPAKKAEIDRKAALRDADAWFSGEVARGYETEDGWKLGLSESDVTLLTGQFVLAKEAAAVDLPLPPVIDTDGVVHQLTLAELTALMLGYGAHRAALSSEYAARKAAIEV
jgi:hypothetical protein